MAVKKKAKPVVMRRAGVCQEKQIKSSIQYFPPPSAKSKPQDVNGKGYISPSHLQLVPEMNEMLRAGRPYGWQ